MYDLCVYIYIHINYIMHTYDMMCCDMTWHDMILNMICDTPENSRRPR